LIFYIVLQRFTTFLPLFCSLTFFKTSEQNKDIQAKKSAPNPLSIKDFQVLQAIIKRISGQTKKPQAIACGWCNLI